MNDLSQTLQDLPAAGLVPIALALIVGLVLWAAGTRVLRAGFAAAGLAVGAMAGWLLGDHLGLPAWIAAVVLGVVFAALAALIYRLAVAGALALVLGVAAPLAVLTVHEFKHGPMETAPSFEGGEQEVGEGPVFDDAGPRPPAPGGAGPAGRDEPDEYDWWLYPEEVLREKAREHLPPGVGLDESLRSAGLAEKIGLGPRPPGAAPGSEVGEHIERLRSYAQQLFAAIRQAVLDAPDAIRPYLLPAAAIGAVLGILLGALVPRFSAAVITAFTGSLLWLGSARIVAEHFTFSERLPLPGTGRAWLTMWVIVAFIGLALQCTVLRRRADKQSR